MNQNSTELYHYGVLGMKWGVRRASKRLSTATTKEDRDKAIAKLNKHREKASIKIAKLDKKRPRLQKNVDRHVLKNDRYANDLKRRSVKYKKKATGLFVSEKRAQKYMLKAMKYDVKSDELIVKSNAAKNRLEKNKTMTRLFQEGINNIDKTLVNKGKRIVNGE